MTAGGLYAWEFEKGDEKLRARVEGLTAHMDPVCRSAGLRCCLCPRKHRGEQGGFGRFGRGVGRLVATLRGLLYLLAQSGWQGLPTFRNVVEALSIGDDGGHRAVHSHGRETKEKLLPENSVRFSL